MSLANNIDITLDHTITTPVKIRRASIANKPFVFTDIYEEEVNIATWQRDLSNSLRNCVSQFLTSKPSFQISITVSPENVLSNLNDAFGASEYSELAENISELVDMFCCLFELSQVGLRLAILNTAMCPKFHVDKVPCRLVTTYHGIATQWLPQQAIDRSKLGAGSKGLADSQSGLYQQPSDIQQLNCGDVALLKGENWFNNENAGLVHRSPAITDGSTRLLLTLDFV